MKIAFDAKRFFNNASGLGNYSRDLVRILAENFPQNEYLLLNDKPTEKGEAIVNLPQVSFVKTSKGKFTRQRKMGTDAQTLNADIFHGLSGELPLKWDKNPIKKIVTIHDLIFLRYPEYYSFFDRKIHLWKFKKAAESADCIIAISEQTKRDIIQYLSVPEEKIRVVYQGCHKAFKTEPDPGLFSKLRDEFLLPEKFILNVGTIEPRKNLLNILKAISGTDIPLVVVGKKQKKYFEKTKSFLVKNKMERQVYFLENISMTELAALYKMAALLVYPSLFEGFGIPVIEALFSGTPVITSNRGCLPEAGGKDSVYINPENPDDIRAKIQFLWNNEAEGKRRAEKGSEFVQKFNDETIAENMMVVYREVLAK